MNTVEQSFLDSEIILILYIFFRLHIMLVDTQLAQKRYKVRFLDAKCLILDRYTRVIMETLKRFSSEHKNLKSKVFFSFFLFVSVSGLDYYLLRGSSKQEMKD